MYFGHFQGTINQAITIFLLWGHFPTNFKLAKLLIESKKLGGKKNGTDLLYQHAKYGGDHGSCAGCIRKSVMFFLSVFVTLWNDEVCDNGKTMKQSNFQNNYDVVA